MCGSRMALVGYTLIHSIWDGEFITSEHRLAYIGEKAYLCGGFIVGRVGGGVVVLVVLLLPAAGTLFFLDYV